MAVRKIAVIKDSEIRGVITHNLVAFHLVICYSYVSVLGKNGRVIMNWAKRILGGFLSCSYKL